MHPSHRLPAPSLLFPWRAWVAHPQLRSWTTWLFVALVAVPPLAYTLMPDRSTDMTTPATVFAFYFATAWFLVLWMVVRPQRVGGQLLAQVVVLALAIEFPVTIVLETALNSDPENLLYGIATIGVPEELAKILPVAVLALARRRLFPTMPPRDVLFLGAVSGLVFGAVEAVHYVVDLMDVTTTADGLQVVWRLVTGPIAHGCWAGIAGYFLGLAIRYREPGPWAALAGLGIGVPAVLHGTGNWVGANVAWVLVSVVSTLLFLAYARVGLAPAPVRAVPGPAPRRDRTPTTTRAAAIDPPTMPIPVQPSASRHVAAGAGPQSGF